MTHWHVRAAIIAPGALAGRNLRSLIISTDGGNATQLEPSIEKAFPECTISAAGPWKWGVDLFHYIPLSDLFVLEARLLAAMKLEPSFAHKDQIMHYTHLPVVQIVVKTPTHVLVTCGSRIIQRIRDRFSELELSLLAVTFDSDDTLSIDLVQADSALQIRRLRAVINFLVLRFDPQHSLTREVMAEPLP